MSVRVEKNGPVTTIVLARPEAKNAVDRATADALLQAFLEFDADPDARAGVLFGEGGTFCAGADLKAVARGEPNRLEAPEDGAPGPMGISRLILQKPVIAAIAGHAVAGGLELALWCDLRVVEEDAVLGVFCRRWGVPLIDGGTVRLPQLIGLSRALDLILTGRPVDAREALAFGLANRIVAPGSARTEAEALAASIATFPQRCLRNDRRSAFAAFEGDFAGALSREWQLGLDSMQDARAGAIEFASGRGRHGSFEPLSDAGKKLPSS